MPFLFSSSLTRSGARALLAAGLVATLTVAPARAQQSPFAGGISSGQASATPLSLTFDEAIARGEHNNLGLILSSQAASAARGARLSQLQALLPSLDASLKEALAETDLPANGMRLPGMPTMMGPYGWTDLRATLNWSLVDLPSLRRYMAARHNFRAAQLTADDARELVILTVGNAYLLAVADEARIASVEAQVATAKVSLDQAVANHQAGTAPQLDELRSRVDYQSLEQQLIVARNGFEKDKLALARAIGLPLAQSFTLADKVPYAELDQPEIGAAIAQAINNRKDLAALDEQLKAAHEQLKAAHAERLPKLAFSGDYGDIGINLKHSHGIGDAAGTLSAPVFREFALRGQAIEAQAQMDSTADQLNDKRAEVEAELRDALLDLSSSADQVAVARSSVALASEALSEAQQRYASGVSDNLAVSQAEQSVAQANDQFVTSLYRHNVAKLTLARTLGAGANYKNYLGGK